MEGLIKSSDMYKILREGIAIINRIKTGHKVHKISIFCLLGYLYILNLFFTKNVIMYITIEIIRIRVIIRWSWKKIIWFIVGEALSIKDNIIQVAIKNIQYGVRA